MSIDTSRRYTREEYLAFERAGELRHELLDGQIQVKQGGSAAHNKIVTNIARHLWSADRRIEAMAFTMRVKAGDAYLYPDLVMVSGESVLEDQHDDTLLNPTVIVEVLSAGSEARDRGAKFAQYRRIETLREYILMAQHTVWVERFVRDGEQWRLTEIEGADSVLRIDALRFEIPLCEIYHSVQPSQADPRWPETVRTA